MPFKSLKLNATILRALVDEGYETPTPIQAKAIPPILEGRDMLGCAQTGTGKTAAFALPIIQRLSEMPVDQNRRGPAIPRALILSPTRELAAQIGESFGTYGRHAGLSHTVIYGGVSQFHQVKALHRGVDILVATPGRLMDLMDQRIVSLKGVSIFVLDEADRMLDMGFIQPIRRIAAALPSPRQTLLFSATMPKEIMHLADSLLKNPVKVAVTPVSSAVPLIEQKLYMASYRQKQPLLEYLLADPAVERALVFTKTKHGADRVCKNLNLDGVPAIAIHGNKAQNYRLRALEDFRSGKCRVLVATDVAARGLDIDNISHVFNFDLPMEPEAYVHRIGRTGRAGATGIAIAFCDRAEQDMLRQIQRLTGRQIPILDVPSDLPMSDHAMAPSGRERGDSRGRGENRGRGGSYGSSGSSGSSYGGGRPQNRSARPGAHRSSFGSQGARPSHAPHAPHAPRPSHAPHAPHAPRPAPSHAPSHAPAAERRSHPNTPGHGVAHPGARQTHNGQASHAPRPSHAPHPAHQPSQKKQHRKGPRAPQGGPAFPMPASGQGQHPRAHATSHGQGQGHRKGGSGGPGHGAGHPAKRGMFSKGAPPRGRR